MTRNDIFVNILTGKIYSFFERWGVSMSPHYLTFGLFDEKGVYKVIPSRLLRNALSGEIRKYNNDRTTKLQRNG